MIFGSRTKGKKSGNQFLKRDGWIWTVVRALSTFDERNEMTIVSNEPGDVATAGKMPIWIQLEMSMKYLMSYKRMNALNIIYYIRY